MSSLVRGSKEAQQADAESDKDNTVLKGLTDTEIYGNLFLYNYLDVQHLTSCGPPKVASLAG